MTYALLCRLATLKKHYQYFMLIIISHFFVSFSSLACTRCSVVFLDFFWFVYTDLYWSVAKVQSTT